MAIATAIRYRVTINGESRFRGNRPTEDEIARIEEFITNRGGHAKIDECHTEIDHDLIGTGRGIKISDRCIFEIES